MAEAQRKLSLTLYRALFVACKEYVALGSKQATWHTECKLFHKRLNQSANHVSIHPLLDTETKVCGNLVYGAIREGFRRNKNLHNKHSSVIGQSIDDGFVALRFIQRRNEIFQTQANKLTDSNSTPEVPFTQTHTPTTAIVALTQQTAVSTHTHRAVTSSTSSSSPTPRRGGSNIP